MALSDELQSLRDRVLAELNASHDYYEDTKLAWQALKEVIAAGRTINSRNMTTGTVTTGVELSAKVGGYIAGQLTEATFQQFLALFESFFLDLLRPWLTAYPGSLGRKTLEFRSVLELPDKAAITDLVVGKELNEVLYERPAAWFAYLEGKARLGCPSDEEIGRIAEAKAARDVLVHNRGVANPVYESKAGGWARSRDGDRIEITESYHRETWELIRKVVADLSDAAIAKAI